SSLLRGRFQLVLRRVRMGGTVAFSSYGHPLHRPDCCDGSPPVQLENRVDRSAHLRLRSNEYSMGTECLLSTAMPVNGDAYLLAFLRSGKSSPPQSQVSDSSDHHVLRNLSVM